MAKQNGQEADGTPASKSEKDATMWDFLIHVTKVVGPAAVVVAGIGAGVFYAFYMFQQQSHQNQLVLRAQQDAATSARQGAMRDAQLMLTEAHKTTQGSYQSISAMNESMISTINGALSALKTVQEQSDQKVKSANEKIQVINEQYADQKERAEIELTRIQAKVATANSAKAQAAAELALAQARRARAETKLAGAKQEFEKTKEAVAEAKKVRIDKKVRLTDDVRRLTELIHQLAKNSPPACEAPVAEIVEMAKDIRRNHLVDPAALLAAVGANPTRDTMVQLADLESVPTARIREAIDAGIPGFDAWYFFAEEEIYLGVRRTDDYTLSVLSIYLDAGRVFSVDVDDYGEVAMCTIPSPANWDDSLPMVIANVLLGDDVQVSIVDEPSDEMVDALEKRIWSVGSIVETDDMQMELIHGEPITAKVLDLPTLWATQPTIARKGLETSSEFARVDAMRRNAESFSGRLLVPVGFFEGHEDRERLREDTARILNAAVIKKSDRAELGASDLDPKAWGRLAAVVLSRGARFERLEAGSNEVSIELQYLGEWEDSLGASVRLYRPEGTQSRTWQLADLATDIPLSTMMSQQAIPEQRGPNVPRSVP